MWNSRMSTPEEIKLASNYLRGNLHSELGERTTEFSHDGVVLLKFHGIYQQDDRDVRRARAAKRLPLDYSCMVRTAVPGGVITPTQWLALDQLSDIADGTMRLTSRQGVQFHVVHKENLRQLVHDINGALLTTLAACGDVVPNIMANPFPDERQTIIQPVLKQLVQRFRPQTSSYWEIWIDGEKAVTAEPNNSIEHLEPVYGETYLPRKFKIGIAWPGDNSIDVYTQDVGIVPTLSNGTTGDLTGFVVYAGGGLGMSHAREDDTYPRLASELGWVTPDQVVNVVEAIVMTQRDHGNRADRHRARLKYLIDEMGIDWLTAQVQERSGVTLQLSPGIPAWDAADYHGWNLTGTKFTYGLPIPSGRVADRNGLALRTALRTLARSGLIESFIVTPRQDLLISGVNKSDRANVETILRNYGVPLANDVSALARLSIACPALPTCGQALGEAERVLPQLVGAIDKSLADVGVGGAAIRLNMTGCPNGCSRPYTAEIGIVGRTKTTYDVYVGGSVGGERLAERLRADVALADIPALLSPVFAGYATDGLQGETFGDYCNRVGTEQLISILPTPMVRRRRATADAEANSNES
ncbi:MAG: NADPH-dependent assimilatory sulfite reductase hemoprotein subunit [Acidimicrobiaceae bacterium]|nr:NADPH-dependent assimilatory sulfite reductase hemoprotein subunit [Acidimicrobiaceae bacterium]